MTSTHGDIGPTPRRRFALNGPDTDAFDAAERRALVIDILAARRDEEALPVMIEYLADGRALVGSDNFVGGHAANALSAITVRPLGLIQET